MGMGAGLVLGLAAQPVPEDEAPLFQLNAEDEERRNQTFVPFTGVGNRVGDDASVSPPPVEKAQTSLEEQERLRAEKEESLRAEERLKSEQLARSKAKEMKKQQDAQRALEADKEKAVHKLKVTVVKATDLRAADFHVRGGSSDPYCTCQIEKKPHVKFSTKKLV